jgi:hypothetical protein
MKDKNGNLVIELSRILMWYRDDFYKSEKDLPAMIFYCLLDKDSEDRNVLKEFFDFSNGDEYQFKEDDNGLMCWDKQFLSSAAKIKKGKKYKIQWAEYDWGTNAK